MFYPMCETYLGQMQVQKPVFNMGLKELDKLTRGLTLSRQLTKFLLDGLMDKWMNRINKRHMAAIKRKGSVFYIYSTS